MYSVLYLPDFRLQAAVRETPELAAHPLVLLDALEDGGGEKSRGKVPVLALSPAARACGILPGMTASQAQARHAALVLRYRRPDEEKALQERLLDCAAGFTPDFEATAPGLCTLDLVGSPHARGPGGAEAFGREATGLLAREHLRATAGIADNPDLALLAARLAASDSRDPVRVLRGTPDDIRALLAPLPVAALDPSEETRRVLALWGVHTFGDLLALPREDAAERLGAEAARLWGLARGGSPRLLRLVRAPESFAQSVAFEYGIETLEPLLFSLRRLLETLAARLAAVYQVAGSLRLTLAFADVSTHERSFRVPEPCRDVDLLFRILHTHLDGFTAEAPITALALDAQPVRAGSSQFHLFESSLRDPNRFAETLGRLEALLGSDRVGTPEYRASHRPDAGGLRPFQADAGRKPAPEEALAAAVPLEVRLKLGPALRRFRPPVPVRVASDRNRVPLALVSGPTTGRFRQILGPWLVSGDWWERGTLWSRREWDVQLEDGTLYRLASQHPGTEWLPDGVYR